MPVSRRDILKMGLTAAPSLALTRLAEAQIGDPGSPPIYPFRRPLVIPPEITAGGSPINITMDETTADIIPGRETPVWAYNGTFPGPTIRARAGDDAATTTVVQTNQLPEAMSVHLHGAHVLPTSDGHPNDLISPGGTKTYVYPNTQLPTTLWYHDHAVDVTGPHVYLGLAGFYITSDDFEDDPGLNLPTGAALDIPLLFADRLFNRNGTFAYPQTDDAINRGVIGDRILVNGVIQPRFTVQRRKMRFRLLNASNARIYDFRLSNGQPFIQVGTDGGLLPAAVSRTVIRLGPSERADVVIDFTSLPAGTQIYLRNTNRMIPLSKDRAPRELLRFDVVNPVTATGDITNLRPHQQVTGGAQRNFTLGRVFLPDGRPVWNINGETYNPASTIADNVVNNSTEVWRFQNNTNLTHPMHIHLVQFKIVDVGGVPPAPGDDGWKDTINVPPFTNAGVRMRFGVWNAGAGPTGTYVFHCHVLEHEDHAMMAQFQVVP